MFKTGLVLASMAQSSKTAGEIIRLIRTSVGMSQASLGSKIGLTQQAVALMEQGKRKVDFDMMRNIIEVFSKEAPDYMEGFVDGFMEKTSFFYWLEYGCEIKYKPCKLNGIEGLIFDIDGTGFKYFIPDGLAKFLPGECSRYTEAIIKANATNTIEDITDPDNPDNKK